MLSRSWKRHFRYDNNYMGDEPLVIFKKPVQFSETERIEIEKRNKKKIYSKRYRLKHKSEIKKRMDEYRKTEHLKLYMKVYCQSKKIKEYRKMYERTLQCRKYRKKYRKAYYLKYKK